MAQSPFKADVFQVEPGSSGTRTISRDVTTGGLLFVDPLNPSGILLSDLVNLSQVDNVSVVGVAGAGSQYTSVQDAVDAAPTTASASSPYVILIASGVYEEQVVITKDGIVLAPLGYVKIVCNDGHTIIITQDEDIPRFFRMDGLTVECSSSGDACVLVDGSNTRASGSILVNSAPLTVGDTVEVGGFTLTGVSGARSAGGNNFNAALGTPALIAAELAAAIMDEANDFTGTVTAEAVDDGVILTSVDLGAAGNSVTVAVTTATPGQLTPSGANLTGGGGSGSELGSDGITLVGCDLIASGVGSRQVDASYVCSVRVSGGTWMKSSSSSESFFSQVGSFTLEGIGWVNDVQVSFLSSSDLPATGDGDVTLTSLGRANDLITNLVGSGSVTVLGCPSVGDVTINGDQTYDAAYSRFSNVLAEDTAQVTFTSCSRGTLAGAGSAVVSETTATYYSDVVADTSTTVLLDREAPDDDYSVFVDVPVSGVVATVTSRSTTDFTVEFSAPVTARVRYLVVRR